MQIYMNTTGILQVILPVALLQICPRLACRIACFCKQKYMQSAGKNTKIADKNVRTIASKNTRNCTKKLAAIAENLLSHRA